MSGGVQKYDIAMKMLLSRWFRLLPIDVENGKYIEYEIKGMKATLRPDGLIRTPDCIYVLEYSRRVERREIEEAAIKAHLVAIEMKNVDVGGVLVSLEGGDGGYHFVRRTRTRCDVDVIVINDEFVRDVVRGIEIERLRDVEFWERDERAVEVIEKYGGIIGLWLDDRCRVEMARRARREGIGGWNDLYTAIGYLCMPLLREEEMKEIFMEIAERIGPEKAYELTVSILGTDKALELLIKKAGKKRIEEGTEKHISMVLFIKLQDSGDYVFYLRMILSKIL